MKLISWNVNGIRAVTKKDFFTSIQELNPDVLCLQETKAQEEEVKETLSSMDQYTLHANSAEKKGYSGTALLSKKPPLQVRNGLGMPEHDMEGRVQCAEFEQFYLINLYVPNSGQQLARLDYRKTWDADLLEFLRKLEAEKPVIVCGDLNVAHRPIDLKNDKANYNKTAGYTQVEIDGFDHIVDAGFVDVFRKLHPEKIAYTYWSYRFKARERNVGWRIDYFLVSAALMEKVRSMTIHTEILGSDHCPIALEMAL